MANITFTNTAGGVWTTAANWSTLTTTPDSNSSVDFANGTYISSTGNAAWTIQSLNVTFSGVTLDVHSNLTAQTLEGNVGSIVVENAATFTLASLNSNTGAISVSDGGVLTVQNLNGHNGTITAAANGLVNLAGNGTGNFTVAGGTLKVAGNFNGSGAITMNGGTVWIAGQLGNSSYNLDDGAADRTFFDALQTTTTNTFTGADNGDLLGIKGVTITAASYSGTTLVLTTSNGNYTFTHITLAQGDTLKAQNQTQHAVFGTTTFEGASYGYVQLACYHRGTMILTEAGEVPIEELEIGDTVMTLSGVARPIRWIGYRSYDGRFIAGSPKALPVRIAAGALADGVPKRDLVVSPSHAIYIGDQLVPAEHLVNGATIVQAESVELVEYFHLELDTHDVIFAEGAPSETFVDCDNRMMFANGADYDRLYPDDDRSRWAFCMPRLEANDPALTEMRRNLLARAEALGYNVDLDPDLHLLIDGEIVRPQQRLPLCYRFEIPAACCDVRLASRSAVPAEAVPGASDIRRLGVPIQRFVLRDTDVAIEVNHTSHLLQEGFHESEASHRWTDGSGRLPAGLLTHFRGALALELHLASADLPYRFASPERATAMAA